MEYGKKHTTAKPKGRPMPKNSVEMGWGALPMKEQHPILPDDVAAQFDADNEAICRLSLRGLLTYSMAGNARDKYVKKVEQAIRAALAPDVGAALMTDVASILACYRSGQISEADMLDICREWPEVEEALKEDIK